MTKQVLYLRLTEDQHREIRIAHFDKQKINNEQISLNEFCIELLLLGLNCKQEHTISEDSGL